MSFCLWNARSVVNKLTHLQSLVYSECLDIIAITESWLSEPVLNNEILPTDYTIYRRDRSSRGGGVLLCVNQSIPSNLILSHCNLELITVEIKSNKTFLLCVMYVAPGASVDYVTCLCSYLEGLIQSERVLLVGDFNMPDVNWLTLCGNSGSSALFCDLVFKLNLVQCVVNPTHNKGGILDLVFSNDHDLVGNVWVDTSWDKSDHYRVNFKISLSKHLTRSSSSTMLDFDHADYESIQDFFIDHDFSNFFENYNVDLLWSYLSYLIHEAIDLFVPRKTVSSDRYPIWFTPSIRNNINKLRTLKKKNSVGPTDCLKSKITNLSDKVQSDIGDAKVCWETRLVSDFANHKKQKIYKYMKSLSSASSLPVSMSLQGSTASSNKAKAELFNSFFFSVFTTGASRMSNPYDSVSSTPSMSSISFTSADVYDILASLDPSKAMGVDNIGFGILKFCSVALSEPIYHLFQCCLSSCCLPAEWKVHRITPVYKAGDRSLIKNYRPISLLCSLSKVLEKLVFNNIIEFVTDNVVNASQFGFLRKRSCIQQLLIFVDYIQSNLVDGSQVDAIYLDFRKAFDSVPHVELLSKLRSSGITGNLWRWFKAYLTNRLQYTRVNNCDSSLKPVLSGVPQGSILGPILFILYLNDLPVAVSVAKLLSFADDTKCFRNILSRTDVTCFQSELDNIMDWSDQWRMSFNISKFAHIQFTSGEIKVNSSYTVGGEVIPVHNSHNDLGILLSDDLSWSDHYSKISGKAYGKLALIRRTFSHRIPVHIKKSLYTALVKSQLLYGSQVWRPSLIRDIKSLERIQRRATKYILNDFTSNYKERLVALNLLPLMYVFELHDIMFFISNYKDPTSPVREYVSFSSRNTRSGNCKLAQSRSSNNKHRHFYFNRLPRLWNSLPIIDMSMSTTTLKKIIKSYLWSHFLSHFNALLPCTFHLSCPCNSCLLTPHPPLFTSFR